MLSIWRRAHQFDRSRAALGTWVFTIARNKRIDALRRTGGPTWMGTRRRSWMSPILHRKDALAEAAQMKRLIARAVEQLGGTGPAAAHLLLRGEAAQRDRGGTGSAARDGEVEAAAGAGQAARHAGRQGRMDRGLDPRRAGGSPCGRASAATLAKIIGSHLRSRPRAELPTMRSRWQAGCCWSRSSLPLLVPAPWRGSRWAYLIRTAPLPDPLPEALRHLPPPLPPVSRARLTACPGSGWADISEAVLDLGTPGYRTSLIRVAGKAVRRTRIEGQ